MTLAEYRRFISYIYAYEGDMKTKNVGFAKIEARNGQCRMSISVKGAYECTGRELTLYGYGKKNGEFLLVPIGQIPVKNGVGEAVFGKKEDDLGGSGLGLTFLQGLFLRSGRHARKAYLTAWDDMLITISRLQQAPVVGEQTEKMRNPVSAGSTADPDAGAMEQNRVKQLEKFEPIGSISPNSDMEFQGEKKSKLPWGMREISLKAGSAEAQEQELHKETGALRAAELELLQKEKQEQASEHEENEGKPDQPKGQEQEAGLLHEQIAAERLNLESYGETEAAAAAEPVVIEQEPTAVKPASANMTAPEPPSEEPAESDPAEEPAGRMPDPFYFREGLTELPLWDSLKRIMPRRMREQKTPGDARWQYIVGVPGIFKPQEKFMAAMFGLPEFKRADSREEGFGFWCGNVCMK